MSLAELFFEVPKLKQGPLATALLFCRRTDWRGKGRSLGRLWAETNAADVEVFLEAVESKARMPTLNAYSMESANSTSR